jgi:DNA topoisomerase IB
MAAVGTPSVMPRLRRVDCSGPGITRRGRGRGFEFFWQDGTKVTDPDVVARCRALVIPPAWREVWICPHPNGHLQAVGTDAAGRRQYRYHDDWRRRRDAEKFDRMLDFGRALPGLREACAEHLTGSGGAPSRERVLSGAVRLLDFGFFRVGGTPRSAEVESFGLTTLRKDHVTILGDEVQFDYPAKGGIDRFSAIVDAGVRDVIVTLRRRRGGGQELLAWKAGRRWVDVTARDVNEWIKAHSGPDFSAKDFRTWHATVLAAVAMAASANVESKTARRRAEVHAVKEVAHYLGNTPTVARSSYIDPRVFDRYRSGWTIGGVIDQLAADAEFGQPAVHGAVETAVIGLLDDPRDADVVVRGPLL